MKVEFQASIPMIQSAMSVGGDQSVRLKLDVPATEIAAMVALMGYGCGKPLRLIVETEDE